MACSIVYFIKSSSICTPFLKVPKSSIVFWLWSCSKCKLRNIRLLPFSSNIICIITSSNCFYLECLHLLQLLLNLMLYAYDVRFHLTENYALRLLNTGVICALLECRYNIRNDWKFLDGCNNDSRTIFLSY